MTAQEPLPKDTLVALPASVSAQLPLLTSAPGGIKKLRELILELAVRGKLVPQDSAAEPASELLKRIEAEKQRLVAEKKIRKQKVLPSVAEDEQKFSTPSGWQWTRLGMIGDWGAGATPKRSNHDYYGGHIPWFKSGELTGGYIDQSEESVTEQALAECSLRQNKVGDVLIAMYGATIGKTAILAAAGTTNQAVCACTPFSGILNLYLHLLLKAKKAEFTGQGAGGAQPNISREKIIATPMALPPLPEQHRIVAKVDELMALCDRLEARQGDLDAAHQQLVTTLLGTLTQSQDAADFAASWQRISTHFDTLFATEASIDQLKQTLLQLAVMGRLVPQDPEDEPASELLKRIDAEKQRLVGEKKIKKPKALPPVSEEEKPYALPVGWAFVRLGAITNRIGSGSTPRGGKSAYVEAGIPFLRSQNVWNDGLKLDDVAYIPLSTHEKMSNTVVVKGDVLLNITGASLGRCTLVPDDFDQANVSQHVTIIRPTQADTRRFLHLCIMSPYVQGLVWGRQVGMAREGLSKKVLELFEIPFPPISEQHRIVAKVDELMALCDHLKARLSESRTLQQQLAGALVERAVGQ